MNKFNLEDSVRVLGTCDCDCFRGQEGKVDVIENRRGNFNVMAVVYRIYWKGGNAWFYESELEKINES